MESDPLFKKLNRRKKAYQEVADLIRGEILKGRLTLAQRLPTEEQLAEQFGVSRSVVREAIRILELTGFLKVSKGAKGGIFVAQDYDRPVIDSIGNMMQAGDIKFVDLFTVRRIIESYAVQHLARAGSAADFAQLHAILAEQAAAAARGENIRSYNIRFHRLIVRLTDNALLAVVGETAIALITEQLAEVASTDLSGEHLEMHGQLLDALTARDAGLADEVLARDISSLERVMASRLPHLLARPATQPDRTA